MKSILEHRLLAFGFFFVLAGSLNAANRIWDGGGLTPSIKDAGNWDGAVPMSGIDTLQVGLKTGTQTSIGFDTEAQFLTPSLTFLPTATTPYTVTAITQATDTLTLTSSGIALQNQSPVRHQFSLITTIVGTNQTWDGGAGGFVLAQIDLGIDHVLTVDGAGTSSTTRNEISGKISGNINSGLTKAGLGTLLLNNDPISDFLNDYGGPTTIQAGKLRLGFANQIPNTSKLVLGANSTFETGGLSDTMGTLLLNGNAVIDLGAGSSSLIFSDSHLELWTVGTQLDINSYDTGTDSVRVLGLNGSGLGQSQLNQIRINGMSVSIDSSGFLQPIPEPGVSTMLLAGACVFASYRGRRKRGVTV